MTDSTLARALRAMAHPLTLGWVLVLILNDHLLRWRWPGWVTGKLGDVAWLAFAPLVVAVALALVTRERARGRRILAVAIGLVGVCFVFVKTVSPVTLAFRAGFESVFGWAPLLVHDPTDLLALPALAYAWWIWPRSGPAAPHRLTGRSVGDRSLPRRAWWIVGLAALVTLANAAAPDEGILCLTATDDSLIAGPRYGYAMTETYVSADGLAWSVADTAIGGVDTAACPSQTDPWTYTVPTDGGEVVYRFHAGRRIERSEDGGETWRIDYGLVGQDARAAYYQATRPNAYRALGPFDAAYDADSGNLVLAMGHDGVLVRTDATEPDGEWRWVPVGDYRFEPITSAGQIAVLLQSELFLALIVALLGLAMVAWRRFHALWRVAVAVVALGVPLVLAMLRPATIDSYGALLAFIAVGILGLLAIPLAILAGVRLHGRRAGTSSALWRALGLAVVSGVLFLVPFVLWGVGVMPFYAIAMWAAIIVAVVAWVALAASGPAPLPPRDDPGTGEV